ncbi:protein twisted gastrulation-like [Condylostylus longicornis]|uniref:protein twisted gastrulation-like n=1 Tax=Condylostylus longicornis TaxID=2530218 RepID=UPI00244E3F5F|nr:protein twisted gastrulation-like [Condylostylus longicornis]
MIQTCLNCNIEKCDKSFKLCMEKKLCECNSTSTQPVHNPNKINDENNKNSNNIKNHNKINNNNNKKQNNKMNSKLKSSKSKNDAIIDTATTTGAPSIITKESNNTFGELKLKCRPSKNCFKCMGDIYAECCNCVDGLCPKTLLKEDLSRISHVGDFRGERNLFNAITKKSDSINTNDEWKIFTFPNDLSAFTVNLNTNEINELSSRETNICTVLFMDKCLSSNQCVKTCESLGANSYRWFHNGCCECIGEYCLNYGISRSQCKICGNEDTKEGGGDDDNDDEDYFDEKDEL